MAPNSLYPFCLFCFKTIQPNDEIIEISNKIKTFFNHINPFVKNGQTSSPLVPVSLLKYLSSVDNVLNCCTQCKENIEGFCDKYEQLKILEMELDWKLDKLMGEINNYNVLPTRYMHVDKILMNTFQSDLVRKNGGPILIKELRQCVVNAANEKRKQSQPRVIFKRNKKLDQQALKIGKAANNANEVDKSLSEQQLEILNQSRICPKCGKELKTIQGFQRHMEIHKDPCEWKYECTWCSKKFAIEKELNSHIRIHTGEKPYECRYCEMKYRIRQSLTSHLKNVHGNEEGLEEELKRKWTGTSKNDSYLSEFTSLTDDYIKTEFDQDVKLDMSEYDSGNNANLEVDPLTQVKIEHLDGSADNIDSVQTLQNEMSTEILAGGSDKYENKDGSVEFKCLQCEKTFKHKHTLSNHLEQHKDPSEWKWKCDECFRTFATKENLRKHMDVHKDKNKIQCPHCPKKFAMHKYLNAHMNNKHPNASTYLNKPFGCQHCHRRFDLRRTLLRHMHALHSNKKGMSKQIQKQDNTSCSSAATLQCEICKRKFTALLRKDNHFKNYHDLEGNPSRKTFKCNKTGCTAYFLKRCQLVGHRFHEHGVKEENESPEFTSHYACPKCEKMYSNLSYFNRHMLTHLDPSEWKFGCGTCGKRFVSEYRLNLHMTVHTREKKYACKFCGNKFRHSNSLGIHLRSDHKDEKEVQADIALRRSKQKEASVPVEKDALDVKEECDIDLVEIEEVAENEIMERGEDNGNDEREDLCTVVDEMVVNHENTFDDEAFVDLEEIY